LVFANELKIKQILLCAFLFPGKIVPGITWGYLRLAGTFKFSPAQVCLEEIQPHLSEKPSREK
jgi:hypothetical protein